MTINKRKIMDVNAPNKSTGIVNGETSNVLNWDDVAFPWAFPKYKKMLSNFWTPFEINMAQDIKQYPELSDTEKDAFLKIIGLLATLDGPQTDIADKIRAFTTDPSVKSVMATIADQESEHNHSYSYVLSSVTNLGEQNATFDIGRTDEVLLERNARIIEVYNEFADNPTVETVLKAMVYTSLLEGLFFYSGFAFFYNLARNQKMVGTSTMISYINRDELQHGRFVSELFRATLAENPGKIS